MNSSPTAVGARRVNGPERRATVPVAELMRRATRYLAERRADLAAIRDGEPARWIVLTSLGVVTLLALGFCLDMLVFSRLEYRAAQAESFNHLRNELALGSAPVSQVDRKGFLLRPGTPVALLEIPKLHMRAVVAEGSTPQVLMRGPGLYRTTVLPGQTGVSAILGRAAAYGGPFHAIGSLREGDPITVTTGAGRSKFSVVDVRHAHDPIPPLARGKSRLILITATGLPFLPSGVLYVDADLTSAPQGAAAPAISVAPPSERPLGTDTSNLWELLLLLQAMAVATLGAVWCWRRWGHAQTWIVFFPLFGLIAYFTNDQVARLLPNLM